MCRSDILLCVLCQRVFETISQCAEICAANIALRSVTRTSAMMTFREADWIRVHQQRGFDGVIANITVDVCSTCTEDGQAPITYERDLRDAVDRVRKTLYGTIHVAYLLMNPETEVLRPDEYGHVRTIHTYMRCVSGPGDLVGWHSFITVVKGWENPGQDPRRILGNVAPDFVIKGHASSFDRMDNRFNGPNFQSVWVDMSRCLEK